MTYLVVMLLLLSLLLLLVVVAVLLLLVLILSMWVHVLARVRTNGWSRQQQYKKLTKFISASSTPFPSWCRQGASQFDVWLQTEAIHAATRITNQY